MLFLEAEVKKLSERVRPEVDDVASLPQVQRKLRKLEELDEQLARRSLLIDSAQNDRRHGHIGHCRTAAVECELGVYCSHLKVL